MYIAWGRDFFGSVDKIAGVCIVRTLFPHFMMFPIFPYLTVLVVMGRGAGEPSVAVPIRRSWKSIGFAWFRAVCFTTFLVALAGTLDQLLNQEKYRNSPDAVLLPWYAGISVLGLVLFLVSYPLSRPGLARREYLLQLVDKVREREAAEAAQAAAATPPDPEEQRPAKPWHRPHRG